MDGLTLLNSALQKAQARESQATADLRVALRLNNSQMRESAECRVAVASEDAKAIRRAMALVQRCGE